MAPHMEKVSITMQIEHEIRFFLLKVVANFHLCLFPILTYPLMQNQNKNLGKASW